MSHGLVAGSRGRGGRRLLLAMLGNVGVLGSSHAAGVTSSTAVTLLDPVVVTATRTDKTLSQTPVRTEIVTDEELRRTHARTLTEALQDVAGLQLQQVHGKSGYRVSLQGLSSDQVLVLIDGLPLSASTGSTVDLSQFTLAEVERIEIVKGATSAQYGSAAMGGVINVVTRRIGRGLRAGLRADVGSYGAQNPSGDELDAARRFVQASVEGGGATLRGRLAADVLDDDGFSTDPDAWTQQGDAMQRQQVAARLDWQPHLQGRVWLDGNRYEEDDDSRYLYYAPPNDVQQNKAEAIERDRLSSGGQWHWGSGWRAQLQGLNEDYDSRSREYSAGALIGNRHAAIGLQQLSAQLDLPRWAAQVWTWGLDYRRETLTQTIDGDSELSTAGEVVRSSRELFAQDDIALGESLELLLGLRVQDDSDFGGHAAPKVALRQTLPAIGAWQGAARFAFGQGYRVPNLKERHYLFDHSALGYMVIGNPELQPESSDSWQLGIDLSRGTVWRGELNLFLNEVEDLIQTDLDNAQVVGGVAYYSYENITRARTYGAESVLQWQPLPLWSLRLAYTWTATEDLGTGEALTRRPEHMARLGMDWDLTPATMITVRSRYQSSESVDSDSNARSPAWLTADLKINHQFANGIGLFAGIDNVGDAQRDFADDGDFGPVVGRYVYLGLRYHWASL